MNLDARVTHDQVDGPGYGSLRTYLIGFGLAAILSVLAFWIVSNGGLGGGFRTELVVAALALGRVIVHMVYFLRVNATAEGGWTFLALIFTLMVVVLVLIGSLWVMYHLNTNTMPMPGTDGSRGM